MLEGSFRLVESDFLLGAPVYVFFEYSNTGPQTISFAIGNGSDDGFQFFGPSEGVEQLDPYFELGGLAEVIMLEPRMKGSIAVLLNRYIRFIQPGKYQIRCQVDLEVGDELLNPEARVEVRDTVCLNLYQDPEQLNKIIAEFDRDITEGDLSTQSTQIGILSELRLENAIPILSHGLRSESDVVVELAIIGLGNLGGQEALEALKDFIASSTSPSLQQKARQEMEKISPASPG